MRLGRRWVRWVLGSLGGMAVLVSNTGGYSSGCDCQGAYDSTATEHGVTVQVMDAAQHPMDGVQVTVWVIDVDRRAVDRAPIVAGTAATDGDGLAKFTYTSVTPPYVCGFRVMDAAGANVLAEHPPTVSDQLSTTAGYVSVVVP